MGKRAAGLCQPPTESLCLGQPLSLTGWEPEAGIHVDAAPLASPCAAAESASDSPWLRLSAHMIPDRWGYRPLQSTSMTMSLQRQ